MIKIKKKSLKIKDKRAFFFYIIATFMLWQLGATIRDLCVDTFAQISTRGSAVLSFVYAKNTGGAFSLFEGHPYLLALFAVLVLGALVAYVYKRVIFNDKFKILALVLFSAGILGNLYERITLGYVVDYVKLNFVNFAVFNVFDVMICASVFIFILMVLYEDIILICNKNGKNKS